VRKVSNKVSFSPYFLLLSLSLSFSNVLTLLILVCSFLSFSLLTFFAFTFAPAAMSMLTHSLFPFSAAQWRGVYYHTVSQSIGIHKKSQYHPISWILFSANKNCKSKTSLFRSLSDKRDHLFSLTPSSSCSLISKL